MLALNPRNIKHYAGLMRVDKPIGSYLVAWPALWSLWIAAKGVPDYLLIVVFVLGAFLMRSAGCVINDFADRDIYAHIERTKQLPLATGVVTAAEAIQLFVLLCLSAACLLFFTNQLTVLLSFGAVMLAALYPFTKRFTQLPQVVLGMAFSFAIPMAFAAQTNELPFIVLPLYIAVVIWVVAYDTFYAMVDREDDLKIGVKSTAILFGRFDKLITGLLQSAFVIFMLVIGDVLMLGRMYFAGFFLVIGLFIYQQWLIKDREKYKFFSAFLNNNYVGLLIFIALVADYAMPIPL
jgi:4-hydroxybenzoate polyprenyltransferase